MSTQPTMEHLAQTSLFGQRNRQKIYGDMLFDACDWKNAMALASCDFDDE